MTESLSSWLALREPYDSRARSAALTDAFGAALPHDRELRILDLGTGTGSNIRYLASRLPPRQRWLLVDRDAHVLADLPRRMRSWAAAHHYEAGAQPNGISIRRAGFACEVETREMELGALGADDIISGHDVVTASALLDLVSDRWLCDLARTCRATGAAVLFALTYNGQSRCSPVEPEDDFIRDLFNQHQRANDKGFGPAAGPDAVDGAARAFANVGYRVRRDSSDWVLTPDAVELQRQLIKGWAEAATRIAPAQSSTITDWFARRLAHVEAQRSHIVVGHEDLAARL